MSWRAHAAIAALFALACSSSGSGSGAADGGPFGGSSGAGATGGVGATGGTGATGGVGASGGAGGGAGASGASGSSGGCAWPGPDSIVGPYLFTASASISPSKPFVFLAELESGAETLFIRVQPLAAADRKTPVGEVIGPLQAVVSSDGKLNGGPFELFVPGEANPITGSDIEISATLTGEICGVADFYCGDLSGDVTSPVPLDLSGSTFTLQRVSDPSTYPEPPHINCAMAVAEPLSPNP